MTPAYIGTHIERIAGLAWCGAKIAAEEWRVIRGERDSFYARTTAPKTSLPPEQALCGACNAQAPFLVGQTAQTPFLVEQALQVDFDLTIGRLDNVLSKLVNWGRGHEHLDVANKQTLKHHAEDMIAAGQKILKDLGAVEGLPQPGGTS